MHQRSSRVTRYQKSRQRHAALEQQVADLQQQVTLLHLNNKQLQLNHEILQHVCEVTSLLLQLLARHGPTLEPATHLGAHGSVVAAVMQLEGCVRGLLGDRPGGQLPQQPIPPPQCQVASLDGTMAGAVMDGSCLSLVRYVVAQVAAHPQAYAHVSDVTPQDRQAALAELSGDLCDMLISDSNGSGSSSTTTSSSNTSSRTDPGPGRPAPLLTATRSRLQQGVTPLQLARRMLKHIVVGILGHVMNAQLPFKVALACQPPQQFDESYWRSITASLGLTLQQVEDIAAATAAYERLQEQLKSMQEALLGQVGEVLADARSGAGLKHAPASEHRQQQGQAAPPPPPQQQQQQAWEAHESSSLSGPAQLENGAAALLAHHQRARGVGLGRVTGSSDAPAAATLGEGPATAAASATAATSNDVPLLSPASYQQVEGLCDRLAAVARKLAWLQAVMACHITGIFTVRQAALFVINTHPYAIPVCTWARWLGGMVALEGPAALAASTDVQQQQQQQQQQRRRRRQRQQQQQPGMCSVRGVVVGPVEDPLRQRRAGACSHGGVEPGWQPGGISVGNSPLLPTAPTPPSVSSGSSSGCALAMPSPPDLLQAPAAHGLRQEAEAGASAHLWSDVAALPVQLQPPEPLEQQHLQYRRQQQQRQQEQQQQGRVYCDQGLAQQAGVAPSDAPAVMHELLTLLAEADAAPGSSAEAPPQGALPVTLPAPPPACPLVGPCTATAAPQQAALLSEQELNSVLEWLVASPD